jgi:6-pyruvoyltetrahydropterin/6-carboxytetrahydropterin synthase
MREYRFTVYKEQDFSAAHFLREYHGECERLHGHNYIVRLYAGADELNGEGLVADFGVLKAMLKEILARFDHHLLNDIPPFDTRPPSSELLAEYIAEEAARQLDDERVRITECRVWETARNCASYKR